MATDNKGHFTHLEDELFMLGVDGPKKIATALESLIGGIPSNSVTTKIDGSPAIVYGYKEGKFFVATKSFFNKEPKVNYTPEDIEENHGIAPGLVKKLNLALKHLKTITPKKDIVLQGDFLFSKEDISTETFGGKTFLTFQPNTLVTGVDVESPDGQAIKASVIGFSPHSKFINGDRAKIEAADVLKSKEVWVMPVEAPSLSGPKYVKIVRSLIDKVNKLPASTLAYVSGELSVHFMQYFNVCIRLNKKKSYSGFVEFLTAKLQKEIDGVKMEKTKAAKTQYKDRLLADLDSNRKEVSLALDTHTAIERVKDALIAYLDKEHPFRFFFRGELSALRAAAPEGYVAVTPHGTSKFVNRSQFSAMNFQTRNESESGTAVIIPLGRFNPPHLGHMKLINETIRIARVEGASPIVYVSLTQDKKKNPLSADEKIQLLQKIYPTHPGMFKKPPTTTPTIIGALKELSGKYRRIVIVLGEDRASSTLDLARKYNGKEYSFDEIVGHSVSREFSSNDDDASGNGLSASEVRRWALEGDFAAVRKAMHKNLSDADVHEIITKIQARVKS